MKGIKKVMAVVIVLSFALTVFSGGALASDGNLLVNGDFETGTTAPANWSISNMGEGYFMTDGVAAGAPSGNNYIKYTNLTYASGVVPIVSQAVTLEPDTSYVFSFYYKSSSNNKGAIKLEVNSSANPQFRLPTASGWRKAAIGFKTSAVSSGYTNVQLRLISSVTDIQYVLFDDICLEKASGYIEFLSLKGYTAISTTDTTNHPFSNIGYRAANYSYPTTDGSYIPAKFYSASDEAATVFTTLYKTDENGARTLMFVNCTPITSASYGTADFTTDSLNTHVASCSVLVPNYSSLGAGSYEFTAFAWNSTEGMLPLTRSASLSFTKE